MEKQTYLIMLRKHINGGFRNENEQKILLFFSLIICHDNVLPGIFIIHSLSDHRSVRKI